MDTKLTRMQILSVSCMLFSIFFGAGNMIFPPAMGQLAGENFIPALLGFIVTDVGIAVLGVLAVVFAGTGMEDMAGRINRNFGIFITVAVYLLIGPLFALPRTGSVSFELGVAPFFQNPEGVFAGSVLYTFIFFLLTFLLSLNPNKIVDIVGKVLTPFLLLSIAVIFVTAFLNPVGEIVAATGTYQQIPFFEGLVQGYLALDGFAGLVFAITVTNSLKNLGVSSSKGLMKYTFQSSILAALLLIAVYGALTYVGALTSSMDLFSNGGVLLSSVTHTLFGQAGSFIIGIAVILACLTTSVGLTTSFGDYFAKLIPAFGYQKIIAFISVFSFVISNIGLSTLISVVLPILIMLYPVITVMITLSFFHKHLENNMQVYYFGMAFAFAASFFDGLRNAGISLGFLSDLVAKLPYFKLGIGWVIPAIVGCILGLVPIWKRKGV